MPLTSCAAVVRKFCREWKSEAYPCREKLGEISGRFLGFLAANALLAANLCDNPANLCDNRALWGDDRPYDEGGIVFCSPLVRAYGAAPRSPSWSLEGPMANLSWQSGKPI